jgi:hypothetical protein
MQMRRLERALDPKLTPRGKFDPANPPSRSPAAKETPRAVAPTRGENGGRAESVTGVLFDEVFYCVTLVDDQEAVVPLDDMLDLVGFVAGHDREAIALAADALVLGEAHLHALVAAVRLSTLALKLEPLIGVCPPAGALIKSLDPIVDCSQQRLVPSLEFVSLFHAPIL